jgi:branched-chain amino acid transport system substrate-binding protein
MKACCTVDGQRALRCPDCSLPRRLRPSRRSGEVDAPYTSFVAAGGAGTAITNGFKLAINEAGGKFGGREIEYFTVDDESEPAKAPDNVNKLIKRDNVDVVVGTVHSGVALAMAKAARDNNALLIIPNAGADEITGPLCAPNIFRTSFTNSQPARAMGKVAAEKGHKTAVTLTWKYAAGEQSVGGFKEMFEKGGGKVVKEMTLPFPLSSSAVLTEIAALRPDAVYVFFAGGGAVKFVKDYAAAGLKDKIPLYGPGFLTDGTLDAQGDAAQGLLTTLHYADALDNPKNNAFRAAYKAAAFQVEPDVYAMQGYDAGQLLAAGLKAVNGDVSKRDALIKAMETAKIDSPRGPFALSKAHNPVQDFYLRKVEGKQNKAIGVAIKGLGDPAVGCKM